MSFTNYTELQSEIATHLRRDGLSAEIPSYITIAEARFNRILRVREMMVSGTSAIDMDNDAGEVVALPSDWLAYHELYIDGSPKQILTQYTPDHQNTFDDGETTKPYGFTVKGSYVHFFPTPDSAYTVGYTYYQKIPALSSNGTNWLLTSHPDIYLYGALLAATPAIKDDKRIPMWAELLKVAIEELKESNEDIYAGPLVMRLS